MTFRLSIRNPCTRRIDTHRSSQIFIILSLVSCNACIVIVLFREHYTLRRAYTFIETVFTSPSILDWR
jgi:hypothetical protein